MRRLIGLFAGAAILLGLGAGPARAFELGFNSEDLLHPVTGTGTGTDDAGLVDGLAKAKGAGGRTFRVMLRWSVVSPTAPPSADVARDPNWSGYRWEAVDRSLRAIVDAGLTPLPWISATPEWAEGPGRPAVSDFRPPGSWRPDAAALQAFAAAVGTRYRGDFPDPLRPGQSLPRVEYYQAWNEPNLYIEITPQYTRSGGRIEFESPKIFKSLVNAVYDGVKSSDPQAKIVVGATAPFGDYPDGGNRMPPETFWRKLLCITLSASGKPRTAANCPQVRFDVFAHNPYSPAAPTRAALNPNDVTVPDLAKLTSLVRAGVKAGTITPKASKPLWITELGWDSRPDPDGLALGTQATYLAGSLNVLWRQGAERVLWWNVRDEAAVPSYGASRQTGLFFRGATPMQDDKKPAYTAYRFPFTAYRTHGAANVWGKAPTVAPVILQRLAGSTWKNVVTVRPGADGVFSRRVKLPRSAKLRALQGSETSLTWTSR